MEAIKEIYLLGIGRNTPVLIDLAEQSNYKIIGLFHFNEERTGESDYGFSILGSFSDLLSRSSLEGMNFLLTMGDNKIRLELSARIRGKGGTLPSIIHPTAIVSRFTKVEDGVCIGPYSIVQANSCIQRDTIVLSGVNISHDTNIGIGCFIAGGAIIGAHTTLGESVFIGQGTLIISLKVDRIGNNAYIGAGSLVTHSIPDGDIVAGRPAKSIKKISE